MGARLKTIGKVLVVMAVAMFLLASLVRGHNTREAASNLDGDLAPAYRSVLLQAGPPPPDKATFCYTCALALGAAGSAMTIAGFLLRRRDTVEDPAGGIAL